MFLLCFVSLLLCLFTISVRGQDSVRIVHGPGHLRFMLCILKYD